MNTSSGAAELEGRHGARGGLQGYRLGPKLPKLHALALRAIRARHGPEWVDWGGEGKGCASWLAINPGWWRGTMWAT